MKSVFVRDRIGQTDTQKEVMWRQKWIRITLLSQEISGATRGWRRWKRILPKSIQSNLEPTDSLILNFQPAELKENKFLLF